jgi:hypothetical protein
VHQDTQSDWPSVVIACGVIPLVHCILVPDKLCKNWQFVGRTVCEASGEI